MDHVASFLVRGAEDEPRFAVARVGRDRTFAGAVVSSGEGVFVPECRKDPRFARQVAAGTGYVPYTQAVAPLIRDGKTIGCLAVLDRRDGGPYLREDLNKVMLFADLAVVLAPGNNEPVGALTVSDITPRVGQTLTVSGAGLFDADNTATNGAVGPYTFFWQVEARAGAISLSMKKLP